jgi:hypothetical protein
MKDKIINDFLFYKRVRKKIKNHKNKNQTKIIKIRISRRVFLH